MLLIYKEAKVVHEVSIGAYINSRLQLGDAPDLVLITKEEKKEFIRGSDIREIQYHKYVNDFIVPIVSDVSNIIEVTYSNYSNIKESVMLDKVINQSVVF